MRENPLKLEDPEIAKALGGEVADKKPPAFIDKSSLPSPLRPTQTDERLPFKNLK